MTRPELLQALNSLIDQQSELSTVVYAVFKNSHEVKQLNIVNDEINHIQSIFVESLNKNIIEKEEQTLVNVSEADDRANTIFEYDLDLPEGLTYLNSTLNDQIEVFDFNNDDLGNVESLLIEIGTEENQITLIKHLSTVEIFGRGGFLLWKSNQQFERFVDKVLRITPKFHGLKINDTIIFTDINKLETTHGFHDVIVREANASIHLIEELNILESTQGIIDMLDNTSFARKVLKIRNSPVLNNNIPNETIISFTKTHPALLNKMGYNEENSQIILKTKLSRRLFIKMLDDAYLTSDLTKLYYESKAKDAVQSEDQDHE